MKISKRDAKLLLILLGLVLVLAAYLAVYNPYLSRTEVLEAETATLQTTLDELKGYESNLNAYYDGIDNNRAVIDAETEKYPSDVRPEDLVMYAVNMEDRIGYDMSAVAFSDTESLADFQLPPEDKDGTTPRDVTAYRTGMTLSFALGYTEMKNMIDYVAETEQRTSLDAVSVSFNAQNGSLLGTATISKYYLTGAGAAYRATEVPKVPIGTDDLFGTFEIAATP